MALISACDNCGYRPRISDAHKVEFSSNLDESEDGVQTVLHVICYKCGHEWVE